MVSRCVCVYVYALLFAIVIKLPLHNRVVCNIVYICIIRTDHGLYSHILCYLFSVICCW